MHEPAPIREEADPIREEADPIRERASRVLERVEEIPPGFVRTYGDVSPGAPRFGGTVLARWGGRVPWHRVVRADGSLTQGDRQRGLLIDEGVPFRGARVDMARARMPA